MGERRNYTKKDLQSLSWSLIRNTLLLGDNLSITGAPRLSNKAEECSPKPALLTSPEHRGPDLETFVWV